MKSRSLLALAAALVMVTRALGGPPPEVVVQAAAVAAPEPTPTRVPVGTLTPHPAQIVVQAANGLMPISARAPSSVSNADSSGQEHASPPGENQPIVATSAQTPEPANADPIATLTAKLADTQAELDEARAREKQLLEMFQRLVGQQAQIEDNGIEINRLLSDVTLQVKQAQFFSRRATE